MKMLCLKPINRSTASSKINTYLYERWFFISAFQITCNANSLYDKCHARYKLSFFKYVSEAVVQSCS